MTTDNHTNISTGAALTSGNVNTPLGELDTAIGNKTALTTTAKSSLVAAVNELDADVGAPASLTTTAKSNLVAAVNELDAQIGTAASASGTIGTSIDTDGTLRTGIVKAANLEAITTNNTSLDLGFLDAGSKIALGVRDNGDAVVGNAVISPGISNNLDALEGIADSYRGAPFVIRSDGRLVGDFRPELMGADVNHVLSTGQSLAIGCEGTTPSGPVSISQHFENLQFVDANYTSFKPLYEPVLGAYLDYGSVETHATPMARYISELAYNLTAGGLDGRRNYRTLHSLHGIGSSAYSVIKRGGTGAAYAASIKAVSQARQICQRLGLSYQVSAVVLVHGEADAALGTANYDVNLRDFQRDYENDIRSLTGQYTPVPMLIAQVGSWTAYSLTTSDIPMAQWRAAINYPGRIFLVCPEYQFVHIADGKHLTAAEYTRMGEYFARAYAAVVIEGKAWRPVMPAYAWRSGADIYVTFHTPCLPLVFDTTQVSDPGNYGFEFYDDGGPSRTISSVSIVRPDTVKIALSGTPTGGSMAIRYAYTGVSGNSGGPTTGPRGCLRDSAPSSPLTGYDLSNWCIHFSQSIS